MNKYRRKMSDLLEKCTATGVRSAVTAGTMMGVTLGSAYLAQKGNIPYASAYLSVAATIMLGIYGGLKNINGMLAVAIEKKLGKDRTREGHDIR